MNKLRVSLWLMLLTIVVIAAFQGFWLRETYLREKRSLQLNFDAALRDGLLALQVSKLNLKDFPGAPNAKQVRLVANVSRSATDVEFDVRVKEGMVSAMDAMREKLTDSCSVVLAKQIIIRHEGSQPASPGNTPMMRPETNEFAVLAGADSLQDRISISEVTKAVQENIVAQHIRVPFLITKTTGGRLPGNSRLHGVTIGIKNPVTYSLQMTGAVKYLFGRMGLPLLFSLFLLILTIASFMFIYRNMLRQNRLAEMKNEFIGNISHELKTPVTTVSVALEALKDFNVLHDKQRTDEYLGIAGYQLNRLSLLIDNVLRASMFESSGIELRKEKFDLRELVMEVRDSMAMQANEKSNDLQVSFSGTDFLWEGDRLHLAGVIHNLVDNAIKYGVEKSGIQLKLEASENVLFSVANTGIGIPREYLKKIFGRFCRVPHGNTHDVKGHGLGLSYAAHIVRLHGGDIRAESDQASQTIFTVILPRTHVD